MIGRVALGGKYWAHTGTCSGVEIGEHLHYGNNVILRADSAIIPEDVLDDFRILFGDASKRESLGVIDPYADD